MHTHTFSLLGDTLYLTSYQRSCDVPLGLNFNQVQVFFLGMPLKAALGLFVVLLCVEGIMQRLMQQGVEDISALQTIIEGWAE